MKGRYQRPRGPKIAAVGGIIFAVFLTINFLRAVKEDRSLESEIHRLEAEAGATLRRNTELITLTTQYESEEYLERAARQKLGYKKEGEQVVVIQPGATTTPREGSAAAEPGNPSLWWRYFFGSEKTTR